MSNNEPLYILIKNDISNKIFSGELKPGDKIPSVREYSVTNKINLNTANAAFSLLDNEGLTIIKKGKGRFVTTDQNIINKLYENKRDEIVEEFIRKMNLIGYDSLQIKTIIEEKL